jgi:VanZ family protein
MRRLIMALAAAIYMVFTVYFYLKPVVPAIEVGSDKFLHFVGFFAGGFLFVILSREEFSKAFRKTFFLFLIVGPVILEFLQVLSPNRQFDILDMVFNYLGWTVPVVIFTFIVRLRTLSKG